MWIVSPARALAPTILLAALAAGSITAFHGSAAHADTASYTLRLSHYSLPKSIPAGLVKVTVVNDTKAQGEASFAALKPGVTQAQVVSIIKDQSDAGFMHALKALTFVGGVDSVQPGQTASVVLNLTPGNYGVANTSGDKPQYAFFAVTPASGPAGTAPATDASIVLKDMKFLGLPRHLAAGTVTLKVNNIGPSVHHMVLIRLDKGKTQKDVMKALSGPQNAQPAWVHPVGGMDVISPHHSAYLTLNLATGNYIAICFMPDMSKGGEPHAMEGMISSFTVS